MNAPTSEHRPSLLEAHVTGRRLGHAVLAYLAIVVVVVTQSPFRFVPSPINGVTALWRTSDMVMNVVMFVPLGFIYRLARSRGEGPAWIGAVSWGAAFSMAVEAAQFFAPGRFPSILDLVTNTAGAGVGAWLGTATLRSATADVAIRALAVELPLMGFVYLLAPLPWLTSLDTRAGDIAWILVPLALAAGWTIGSVFTSFDRAGLPRVMLVTAAWLLVALGPTFLVTPVAAVVAAAAALAAAWLRSVAPERLTHESHPDHPTRRFESSTLKVVLPLLVLTLVLAALMPFSTPSVTWRATWALSLPGTPMGDDAIFRAIAHISAFLLFGYAIAEYHGRSREGFGRLAPRVLGWATALSVVLEVARGWHPAYGASATIFLLTLAGAALGGWIYTLQLAHVRALAARRDAAVLIPSR